MRRIIDRPALAALAAAGFALAALGVSAPRAHADPPAAPADQMRLQGFWALSGGDHSAIRTIDGKLPPMKPEAKARYDAAVAARRAGKPVGDTAQECLSPGLPRTMLYPQPFLLKVDPTQVSFIHELMHQHRLVYLNEPLPSNDDLDQDWLGFSVGHWDNGVLVIQTHGFNDQTTIDTAGIPHSTDLMLTEKLRLADKDTLEDTMTIDDPKTFTAPWQARVTFKRLPESTEFKEYVCTLYNPEKVAAK
jgi:hypothetical protein